MGFQYMTPKAVFVSGNVVTADYLPAAAVAAGDIVKFGTTITPILVAGGTATTTAVANVPAIAPADIAASTLGAAILAGDGVFDVINGSNGGTFANGQMVSWSFTNGAACDLAGVAPNTNQANLGPAITSNFGTYTASSSFSTNDARVRLKFTGGAGFAV